MLSRFMNLILVHNNNWFTCFSAKKKTQQFSDRADVLNAFACGVSGLGCGREELLLVQTLTFLTLKIFHMH